MNSPASKTFRESKYSTAKVINFLLCDTRFSKHQTKREKSEKLKATLTDTQRKLDVQQNVTNKARLNVKIHFKWEKIIEREIQVYYKRIEKENLAAITIQRILKGCIVRAKYTDYIIRIKETKSNFEIFSLRTQTDMCMLTLGINTVPSIIKIQRAYRRYLFYQKVKVFSVAYSMYLEKLKEQCELFIKSTFPVFSSKLYRSHLIFLKYREARLKIIKENLAILSIKKVWRRKKLNIRTLKQKIQRIKRIRIAKQNKEAFEKYLASIGGNLQLLKKEEKPDHDRNENAEGEENNEKNSFSEENKERSEEEKIFKESERIQAMIQNRIRYLVEKGKLAHGIQDLKISAAGPVMENKGSHLNSDKQSKVFESTCSIIAKTRPASRENQKKRRVFIINSPKRTNRLEFWHHFESLTSLSQTNADSKDLKSVLGSERYLSSTECFTQKMRKKEKPSFSPRPQPKKRHFKIKTSPKPQTANKPRPHPNWIPVARSFTKYTPGLDNPFYSPPIKTRDTSKQIGTNFSIFSINQAAANFSTLSFNDP